MRLKYTFLLLFFSVQIFAQQSLTLYNMPFVQQSTYSNLGVAPLSKANIGLPVISSMYFNFANTGFKVSDLIKSDGAGGLNIDPNSFLAKLKKNNYINTTLQIDLFTAGFRIKKSYFGLNVTEKVDVRFRYPKDFFDFLINGNGSASLLGQNINFNFGVDAVHYREWGLYFNHEVIADKLTVGARLKYLSGMQNVNTKKANITLNTNAEDYTLTATSDILINTAGIDTTAQKNQATINGFNTARKNKGFGIDFGANYKLSDKLSFSANVIDLGFISWKEYTTSYVSKNPGASVTYSGFDINKLMNGSASESMGDFVDTLKTSFGLEKKQVTYKTMLSTQIYLGANYNLNEKNNAGVVLYGRVYDKAVHPALTLSYNNRIGRFLSLSASYSILDRSYNNVGFGFGLNLGAVQVYAVSDNIMSVIMYDEYTTSSGSFKFPAYTKNANVRIGMNLVFGHSADKDKDKDGVADKDDECPDDAGLSVFNGCPDKDGDKIIDKSDDCPDAAGEKRFNGCPDTDNDGIKDSEDGCPNNYGPMYTQGCPDSDGDSLKDSQDKCPSIPGPRAFGGCPDKDRDGVPDNEDICPDQAGTKESQGCPDTDKDGTFDHMDLCPDKAGPKENYGCPQVKLHIIDKDGKSKSTAVRGLDETFIFDHLPTDEPIVFKIEGDDGTLNELEIVVKGESKKVKKGTDGLYRLKE
jgi:hypothetical protein